MPGPASEIRPARSEHRDSKARRRQIAELASATGLASVDELSERFGVTPSTIRRDLARLGAEGRIARTYGGAIAIGSEASLRQRTGEFHDAKVAIGSYAATLPKPGETILLDGGSTVLAMAGRLRGTAGLHVVTASVPVIDLLDDCEGIQLDCLGGRLRPLSQSFVGPLTELALSRITVDRLFLGADGVSPELGICEADLDQTRLKEAMAARARHVYVVAHSAKLDSTPFHAWARIAAPWTLITDEPVEQDLLARFERADVEVVVAPR